MAGTRYAVPRLLVGLREAPQIDVSYWLRRMSTSIVPVYRQSLPSRLLQCLGIIKLVGGLLDTLALANAEAALDEIGLSSRTTISLTAVLIWEIESFFMFSSFFSKWEVLHDVTPLGFTRRRRQ